MLVSIIIPLYNCENYIEECLEAAAAQTYKNLEIIVVDDCSGDLSAAKAEAFSKKHENVRVIKLDKNSGVSTARNTGIDAAKGDALLFVDADDVIVPQYVEFLAAEMEKSGSLISGFRLLRAEETDFCAMTAAVKGESKVSGAKFENCSYEKIIELSSTMGNAWDLSAIGGKMICTKLVGDTRFRTDMKYGEDTQFIHRILRKIPSVIKESESVYSRGNNNYYIYRIHGNNAIKNKYSGDLSYHNRLFEEAEYYYKAGDSREAFFWLELSFQQLEGRYEKDKEYGERIFEKIREMKALPSFSAVPALRAKHIALFEKNPKIAKNAARVRGALRYKKYKIKNALSGRKNKVGILTFHCSDNNGAMLQAYALKVAMNQMDIRTEIVNYFPNYMVGRHWFFPYVPMDNLRKTYTTSRGLFRLNRRIGRKKWSELRRNMKKFRSSVVCPEGRKKKTLLSLRLRKYGAYVVGSDQIWNPELTAGLRTAYFGPSKSIRTVAYAASLGGDRIPEKYNRKFSKLISGLSAVSMREKSAVPYVMERLAEEENVRIPDTKDTRVTHVCDPVFLVPPGKWQELSKAPAYTDYILVNLTEQNPVVEEYIRNLSAASGKKVVRLARIEGADAGENVIYDTNAGPAQFLGYIRYADYVITNSFHAAALSILFGKKSAVAVHSTRGARIVDLLSETGLESRILNENTVSDFDIDKETDWNRVFEAVAYMRRDGKAFLRENVWPGLRI